MIASDASEHARTEFSFLELQSARNCLGIASIHFEYDVDANATHSPNSLVG